MSLNRVGGCLDENVIAEFLEGVLSQEKVGEVEAHVDRCPQCRELVVKASRSLSPWSTGSGARTPSETVSPEIGEVIADKYRVEGFIGSGGMGVVVRAKHLLLNRTVALKLMRFDSQASPETIERFMREARASVLLRNEHATRVMDLGTLPNGNPYIVMEYLEGEDLGRLVARNGPLAVGVAASYLVQACEAIAEAHRLGIVHRDIKPSNLFVTRGPDGEAFIKVLDFGLSKRLALGGNTTTPPDLSLTHTRTVMGSPFFMAPEQLLSAREVDARADLWALGATLHFLITGSPPFEAGTLPELSAAVLRDHPRGLPPTVDPRLKEVISSCLEKDPERRMANATELADALAPFAVAPAKTKPPATGRQPLARILRAITRASPPKRRWSLMVTFAIALLLIGIVGAAFLATRTGGGRQSGRPSVFLMDTPVARGVYDAATVAGGGTNADVLNDVLRDLPIDLFKEPIPIDWHREAHILSRRPDLVVIHRSAFFHALNVGFEFGYPPFPEAKAMDKWLLLYDTADDKLIAFIGLVGTCHPHTRFLVYSRGTDGRWPNPEYRKQWVARIEQRFPALDGRITVMPIAGGVDSGTFSNPVVADEIRAHLKEILGLPESTRD